MVGGKILAKFMGFESSPFENEGGKGFDVKLIGVPNDNCNGSYSVASYGSLEKNIESILGQDLKYHKSWNWMMPVIKKMYPIYLENDEKFDEENPWVMDHLKRYVMEGDIEHVFMCSILFTDWDNKR